MKKYVKKHEFKGFKLKLNTEMGEIIYIEDEIITDENIYNLNKDFLEELMFDVEEICTEEVEEKNEIEKEVSIIKQIENNDKEVEKMIVKDLKEQLEECTTVEEVFNLGKENDIHIKKTIRNLNKAKEQFLSLM